MQGIDPEKMQRLIVALQKVDALGIGIAGNKTDLLSMLHKMLPPDEIALISRFFTFPGQDVVMTDANCVKLKLFMAIGMMNQIFNARFKFILRGGFAVRMNILKTTQQAVGSFAATKDMADLIDTASNADLDCLVMPVHGNELSPADQSKLIELLQMSIEKTAESFRAKHSETLLLKMDDVRKHELEHTQKRMQAVSMMRDAITGEDADSQTQKQLLNNLLQKLQTRITIFTPSAAVANPDDFGLTIRPATHSVLTTKMNWKTSGSQVELMDVTVMPVHDATSLYAHTSRMKQIKTNCATWYYPGPDILFIEYLDVMHEVTQTIQQLSSDSEMPPADKTLQLKMQSRKMDKFKSRAKICYGLLNEEERVNLISSLPQNLMDELRRMMQAGGAKKRTRHVRRTKKCTRRYKKRNGRKTRNGRKICQ